MPGNMYTPYPEKSETEKMDVLEIDQGFLRFHTYPTPKEVMDIGLLGVPKRFPMTGEHITLDYIRDYLASSIADIEMTGLTINPINTTKQEDFHDGMLLKNFFPIMVNKYPILDVESVVFIFPHSTMDVTNQLLRYVVPHHWISWERNKINIIASTGPLLPQMTGTMYNTPLALWTNTSYRPNAYTATWMAGFQADKLPYNVWKLAIDMTTYNILMDIGPLLFPISGMSVGIDSVAQSAQYPAHRLLEGRLKMLQERIKSEMAKIMSYYGQRMNISFAGM